MGAKRFVTASVAALALAATGSGGILPTAAVAKETKAANDDPSRRICKNIVRVGTRLSTRVCRTKKQWDEAMDRTQESLLDNQMGPGTTRASPTFFGLPPN